MTFDDWIEDVEFLATWLKSRSPGLPLILHGLELGALLASRVFQNNVGDGLLVWSAPQSANDVLRGTLRRRIAVSHAFTGVAERKPLSDYVQQLEAGQPLEVEGYRWSGKLWRDSFRFQLPFDKASNANRAPNDSRPVRLVHLDKSAAPLVKGGWLAYDSVNPDLTGVFAENVEWIEQAVVARGGNQL
jgi:hypothetical protein